MTASNKTHMHHFAFSHTLRCLSFVLLHVSFLPVTCHPYPSVSAFANQLPAWANTPSSDILLDFKSADPEFALGQTTDTKRINNLPAKVQYRWAEQRQAVCASIDSILAERPRHRVIIHSSKVSLHGGLCSGPVLLLWSLVGSTVLLHQGKRGDCQTSPGLLLWQCGACSICQPACYSS